jgi:flavin-dependent dehydrogenase
MNYDVIIIGGGLAGLCAARQLAQYGIQVAVIEKKQYPFHKVCGEYISYEVWDWLEKSLKIDLKSLNPSDIQQLQVSSPSGKVVISTKLDLGGFGISRYTLDNFIYEQNKSIGVHFYLDTTVQNIHFEKDTFRVHTQQNQVFTAKYVIGSYGKRSNLDRTLNRDFFHKKTPYMAVKYHIQYAFDKNTIALHNFQDGYCGISAIENDTYCLCYLTHKKHLKKYKSISEMEKQVLQKNPFLKDIFANAKFLWETPETINEISFLNKNPVENHIFMVGDSAGLIPPLAGNGMAMAIHAAKIASEILIHVFEKKINRTQAETLYPQQWKKHFQNRIQWGKRLQSLFGNTHLTEYSMAVLKRTMSLTRWLIKQTHGKRILK